MRRRSVTSVALAAVCLAGGCRLVLGLEELPLREDPSEAGPAVPDGEAPDAGEPCVDDPSRGCRDGCDHAFCEDFDRGGDVFSRWTSAVTPAGGVLVRNDAAVTTSLEASTLSPPLALTSRLDCDACSAYALLAKSVEAKDAAAVRLRLFVRPLSLELSPKTFGGPFEDAGAVFVGGLLATPIPARGALLLVNRDGVYLYTNGNDLFGGAGSGDPPKPVATGLLVTGAYVEVELLVGSRARALKEGMASCASEPDGLVVAARIARGTNGCTPLPDTLLADTTWLDQPTFLVGTGTYGPGLVEVDHDNVAIDVLRD